MIQPDFDHSQVYPRQEVNVGPRERTASLIGGAGVILWALLRGGKLRLPGLASGVYLLNRGVTGHCAVYETMGIRRSGQRTQDGVRVERTMTINQRRPEVYRFWRSFENLPRFMKHLKEVKDLGEGRSHWVARGPLGVSVEWDAEIIEESENERIAWQSLPGARVENHGLVVFEDAPARQDDAGHATEIHVVLEYNPPGGTYSAAIARLMGEEPGMQVLDDLRRFKQIMETGEIATTFGQSSARLAAVERARARLQEMEKPA